MATIGREGGHSRGARARAAAGSGRNDVAQGTGSQPFVRQANEERSGFESSNRGFGSQDRNDRQSEKDRDRDFSSRDRERI
jgi:hypothetical protein